MPSATQLVQGIETLASLPAVYQRVKAVVDNPDSSVADLARVVSSDPGITARVLKVVNSVYFGLMSRVETVSHAVSILGMQQLHDIVLASSLASVFKGIRPADMDMRRFWSDSVLRALFARAAAENRGLREVERVFLEGLLADIGHLVMYLKVPEATARARTEALAGGLALDAVERRLVGCDYAEVGAALASLWKLPKRFAATLADQIHPSLAAEEYAREAALLHLADKVVTGRERQLDDESIVAGVDPFVWQVTRLKPLDIGPIRTVAEMNHAEVVGLFFPHAAV